MESASARSTIGTLSQRTGCNIETIRYYERVGLLPAPARSPGRYRLYGTAQLKQLTFIRRARALGFSIDEVRTLSRWPTIASGRAPRSVSSRHAIWKRSETRSLT